MAIISVRQEYKSIEGRQNYRTGIEIRTIYRGREALMDIEKSKDNYNKDGKPRYFNWTHGKRLSKKIRKKRETRNRTPYKGLQVKEQDKK